MKLTLFLAVTLIGGTIYDVSCLAQTPDAYAVWLLPAAQYKPSESVSFALQPGWNPQQDIGLLYASSILKANRWLDINLGYMFLALSGQYNNESTFMNGVTLKFHLGKFFIDNQNLIWNRFRSIDDSYHFIRNRTRLFHELSVKGLKVSPYINEEFWFYFTTRRISRNRTGMGISVSIKTRCTFDFLYTKQWDESAGNLNLFFLRSTIFFK
ncbi:DUF2490 domain-containing protein [Spirosoma harenae]